MSGDIIEPAPILDIFAQDMPRMERLGPCTTRCTNPNLVRRLLGAV